ncbi:MAG: CoA transferase [Pseudomonadota bacterium]
MGIDPLAGIRVLDLTNVLAGPFCCQQLGLMGAEVIKVEAPVRGDLARSLGADPKLNAAGMGISFLAQNAGKRSITLNLKTDAGRAVLMRLIKTADVLVENFRPGVMDRLGLGAEVLRAAQPHLIYAAISGFGQDGPWRDRPAYDQIIQGAAGVMAITGAPDGPPTRVGFPLADTIGGLTAAMAICGALQAQPRGTVIDVSMLDSVLTTMGWVVSNWLIGGVAPTAQGNENPTSAPSGAFQAADGLLNIAANKDEQWRVLAQHLGRRDLMDRPEFATREDRKAHRLVLKAELETVLATRPARDWARELNALGVPAGPVLRVEEALAHPQVAERGLLAAISSGADTDRTIQIATAGYRQDGVRPRPQAAPPTLGADTRDILVDLGYGAAEINQLAKEGVT